MPHRTRTQGLTSKHANVYWWSLKAYRFQPAGGLTQGLYNLSPVIHNTQDNTSILIGIMDAFLAGILTYSRQKRTGKGQPQGKITDLVLLTGVWRKEDHLQSTLGFAKGKFSCANFTTQGQMKLMLAYMFLDMTMHWDETGCRAYSGGPPPGWKQKARGLCLLSTINKFWNFHT